MSGYLDRPAPSGLADVIEVMLDKGVVIDAYARVSALGIELLTLDARIVMASADTYLRYAEATERLELEPTQRGLPELIDDLALPAVEKVAEKVVEKKVAKPVKTVKKAARKVKDKADDVVEKAEDLLT